MTNIAVFDSTLRDGAQAEGISFSVDDKLKIAYALDSLGVAYIEAGNPGSNPKDMEFFTRINNQKLKRAKITAFGSTRRAFTPVQDDANIKSLLAANTCCVAIFGKCWDFHVKEIIRTTLEENLLMIGETIAYLKRLGKEVIFDCEHFFDGYKNNKNYAVSCLSAAHAAGADCLVLCDTNGSAFPNEIYDAVFEVKRLFGGTIGIHCHNDCGMAVAGSVTAVEAGAEHVQGTFLGFGERCGNACLATIIPNLQLKRDYSCILPENMSKLSLTARYVAEVSNIVLSDKEPYVGKSAFAHKGGMHIDGIAKNEKSYEHIDPAAVGAERRFLTSEVSGRGSIISRMQTFAPSLTKDSFEAHSIINKIKDMEHNGYQFEGASSTIDLVILKELGLYKPYFELVNFKVIGELPYPNEQSASALIKVIVDGKLEITAAEGEGPVNALDRALRKALEVFYPELSGVRLIDYKVRVMNGAMATASTVRVLIESSDGVTSWSTVGVSKDIIEASWLALVDSIQYKLIRHREGNLWE